MGVYCYKITRAKKRKVEHGAFNTLDIHTPVFAYTLGGSMFDVDSKGRDRNERLFDKLCKPTIRSWEKAGGVKGTLYVWDYEDGAEVYAAQSSTWYDTGDNGEHVGYLRSDGNKFRFEALKPALYRVTFKGVQGNPDMTVAVEAINEQRAKKAAADKMNESSVPSLAWTSMYPKFERVGNVNLSRTAS